MPEITDATRASMRARFLDMLKRNGYARPIHQHVAVRAAEYEVLEKMASEGLVVPRKYRTDRDGSPNARGRGQRSCWILAASDAPVRHITLVP